MVEELTVYVGPGFSVNCWLTVCLDPKHGIPDPVIEPLLSTFSTSPDDFPSISTIASTSLYKTSHETNLLPDSDLHRTLQEWNARHREGMVSVILQKISTFLESRPVVAALEAIPNSPFMTGTIVRSVSALVIFGVVRVFIRPFIGFSTTPSEHSETQERRVHLRYPSAG